MQSYYTACLEKAQAAGEINKNADPKLLGAFIYNGWQGALLRAKAQGNTIALEQFQKVVFDYTLHPTPHPLSCQDVFNPSENRYTSDQGNAMS